MKKLIVSTIIVIVAFSAIAQDKDKFDPTSPTRYTKDGFLQENRYAVGRKDAGIGFHYRPNGYAFSGDFTYYISGNIGINGQVAIGNEKKDNWTLSTNYISISGQYVFANNMSTAAVKPFGGFALGTNKVDGFEIPNQDSGMKLGVSGGVEGTINVARTISVNLRAEQFMFFGVDLNKYQVGLLLRKTF